MAFPLALAGLGLGAAGLATSLYSQNEAKKEAEKEAKRQRKMDILRTIISVAGGQGVPQITEPTQTPVVDYGGAMQSAGQLAMNYAGQQDTSALNQARTQQTQAETANMPTKAELLAELLAAGYKNTGRWKMPNVSDAGVPNFESE